MAPADDDDEEEEEVNDEGAKKLPDDDATDVAPIMRSYACGECKRCWDGEVAAEEDETAEDAGDDGDADEAEGDDDDDESLDMLKARGAGWLCCCASLPNKLSSWKPGC